MNVATFKVSIAASDRQIHDQIATFSVYKNSKRNKIPTKIVPYIAIPTIFKHTSYLSKWYIKETYTRDHREA